MGRAHRGVHHPRSCTHHSVAHRSLPMPGMQEDPSGPHPRDVAPPKSNFSWGTHFLVGYWSLKGLTTSMLRDLLRSDYELTVSVGEIDKMLARSARLFAPAYEAIRKALKDGKQVNVDWTGWRVDGVNYNLWDFISPDVRAAFFRVDKSAGHTVPEGVLGKRRPSGQVLNCDGAVAFNAVRGKKQRCWVHLLRKAKQGQEGWERPSDAPDWRGLRAMEKLSRRILEVAKWPAGEEKTREAKRLMSWARRWLGVRREGTVALALQKFLTKHWNELWWWAETDGEAHNNRAKQGLRPHIAVKRKLSWGSRTEKGANRTALLASVIQTGQLQGISYRELGARILKGESPSSSALVLRTPSEPRTCRYGPSTWLSYRRGRCVERLPTPCWFAG